MFEVKNVSKIYIKDEVMKGLNKVYSTLYAMYSNLLSLSYSENDIEIVENEEFIEVLNNTRELIEEIIDIYCDILNRV